MSTCLYFDCGISDRWQYPVKGVEAPPQTQPFLTRLSWILDDGESDPLHEECHLVEVPLGVVGGRLVSLHGVMESFMRTVGIADKIVAYGWRHHRGVLDHTLSYRLGWPLPAWPEHGCAMIGAVKLARHEEEVRGRNNNITVWPPRRANQFIAFEEAARRFSKPLHLEATFDPVLAGYERVWVVRDLWLKFEALPSQASGGGGGVAA